MHETVICFKIKEEAEKQGNVKEIVLEVGELAEIRAHDLEHHLRDMTGWKIDVSETKSEVSCECGFEGAPKIIEKGHDFCLFECPKCEKAPKVIKGDEVKIVSVKVD
ncbi:hydrogenase maturation nickel metallochaperone HypA [Candidatus Woesearchaeota archaeon]|nr:hydrogenase maturation nickel metallochaperone HypA [Candidatus Woesearchaeota archaeon]